MSVSRRKFLKFLTAAGAGTAAATVGGKKALAQHKHYEGYPGAYGVLHDYHALRRMPILRSGLQRSQQATETGCTFRRSDGTEKETTNENERVHRRESVRSSRLWSGVP